MSTNPISLFYAWWTCLRGRAFWRWDDGHLLRWPTDYTIRWPDGRKVNVLYMGSDYVIVENP